MGYIQDWLHYNSGNECPERFWRWAGLSLLSHILGRKVVYHHGKFPITSAMYVGLIGDAGSGKTTAKSEVKTVVVENFPDLLYSASIQSREDIVKKMATKECEESGLWQDANGQLHAYRPFYIIANEFKNFLSVDSIRMVDFLVDIFDEKWFSTGFKNAESQSFSDPYVSILSCGTPEWLMTELKLDLFNGGLGRRLILVVDQAGEPCPDPEQPADFQVVKARVVDHLKAARALSGNFTRSESGKKWWHNWYIKHKKEKPTDPILGQFHSTKHVMVLKVAMLIALNDRPFKLELTDFHFQVALEMFEDLIPMIHRLTAGIGRNELAGVGAQLLDFVERLGGIVPFVQIRVHFRRYLQTQEFWDVIRDFESTGQLQAVEVLDPGTGISSKYVGRPDKVRELLEAMRRKALEGSATPAVQSPDTGSKPGPSGPAA